MVEASRNFVCIRPQTYENKEEAKILSWIFADRDGSLRNTSFAILSSDGKKKLSRGGRSPEMVFRSADRFVKTLKDLTSEHGLDKKKTIDALPVHADLRLALNVAASDLRPLVVTYATDKQTVQALREKLAPLAWDPKLVGHALYVVIDNKKALEDFPDIQLKPGITVLQAEPYGRSGKTLVHVPTKATVEELSAELSKGFAAHDAKAKNVRRHLRQGASEGIDWTPLLSGSEETENESSDEEGSKRRGRK